MGMTIDDCINYYNKSFVIGNTDDDRQHNDILEMTIDTMRKYQQLQADYENRLKADLKAMLTDIKAEIVNVYACNNEAKFIRMTCRDIIQQKINALIAESEDRQ